MPSGPPTSNRRRCGRLPYWIYLSIQFDRGVSRPALPWWIVTTIDPDPDNPDPADSTMRRLEMTTAFDEWFPQWRSYVGEAQRAGVALGWLATGTAPAGVELANPGEDEQDPDAVPLTWLARQRYLILRTPDAPELWARAVPRWPVSYDAEAVLLTREIEPEHGTRRWHVLTDHGAPVQLTGHDGGSLVPRPTS
jgi:hypothetical protein